MLIEYQIYATMKNLLAICVAVLMLSACGNRNGKEIGKPVTLPEPTEKQSVVYETDTIRIVSDNDLKLLVQPKFSGMTGFETISNENEYLSFEKVVGNSLIASSGTGVLRTLTVYSLDNGEKQFETSHYNGGIEPDGDGKGFTFKVLSANYTIRWNETAGAWENEDNIPEMYRSEDLETAKSDFASDLFDGLSIGLYIEKHFDIASGEVKDTGFFYWKYVE